MGTPLEARIQASKLWLKQLAAERRAGWMIAVRPRSLDGATAIETRREVIHLEDGVVSRVSLVEGAPNPDSRLVGMRIVGWAGERGAVYGEYVPGTRAILWRRESDGLETSLALTGRVRCFVIVRRIATGSVTVPARGAVVRTRDGRAPDSRRVVDSRPRSGIQRASTRV
jgi:hypothetical protein